MAPRGPVAFLVIVSVLTYSPPPPASACGTCRPSAPNARSPAKRPPKHHTPPYTNPPPAVDLPPPTEGGGGSGGGVPGTTPSQPPSTCPLDTLKLGLCLDALGGLVHVGLGTPAENLCCPLLQGLLELEAVACLCTAIKLRVLNLDIFIPLALQLLITCGIDPAPGYLCPLT